MKQQIEKQKMNAEINLDKKKAEKRITDKFAMNFKAKQLDQDKEEG